MAGANVAPAGAQSTPPGPLTDANGVPTGIAPPVIRSAPPGDHSILAVGDSDLAQGLFKLPEVLGQHGVAAQVYDAHGSGWGLLDPLDGMSALDVLADRLAAHPDVDTVVIGFEGVCAFACGPGKLAYGSQRFYDAWDAAARALVTERGVRAVSRSCGRWRRPRRRHPPTTRRWRTGSASRCATRSRPTLAEHARAYGDQFGIATVDWTQALSDSNGGWQSQLSYDGAVHTVRLDDKVHLTEDASVRTSTWTTATLTQLWRRPQVESVV